jgi:hypothetical protein
MERGPEEMLLFSSQYLLLQNEYRCWACIRLRHNYNYAVSDRY